MKFKPYPKYKASGVEWLGDVPETWTVSRLKWSIKQSKGGVWGNEPAGDENDLICIRVADFNRDQLKVDTSNLTIRQISISEQNGRRLEIGDLLLEKSGGGENQPVGCVIQNDQSFPAVCSNFITRLTPSETGFSNYFKFVHTSLYSLRLTTRSINQTSGIQNLDTDRYLSELVGYPSAEEQSAIATFLDRETAKIDSMIAKQEKLIDLLKEKRQAVISHAVTKGLDPTAPMKPSGVEWLGDVPEHWELAPIKHLALMASGGTPSKDRPEFWNGPHPWASAKDLKVEVLHDTEDHITDEAIEEGGSTLVPSDSVLIVVRGMILLHTLPVTMTAVPMAINQDLKALRTLPNCIPKYLAVLLRGLSKEILGRTDQAAHGTKALRMSDWTGMLVPLPSIPEQHAVVERIESQTTKIDILIAKAQQAIALQKEHRTALISAAVTGKIDVREAVQELQQAA